MHDIVIFLYEGTLVAKVGCIRTGSSFIKDELWNCMDKVMVERLVYVSLIARRAEMIGLWYGNGGGFWVEVLLGQTQC